MATQKDVVGAVKEVSKYLENNGWAPRRVTHIEKEAYSILFAESEGENIASAIKAIHSIQNHVARNGWKHDPLVIIFPFKEFRINVTVPASAKARGKHVVEIQNTKIKTYAAADEKILGILRSVPKEWAHVISNSVHESFAAWIWAETTKPDALARNVEITVPTPYPDPIRYKIRAKRDYGITISEFDAVGTIDDRIRVMEAKAASYMHKKWETIVRHKILSYRGALAYFPRTVRADFVITGNNRTVTEFVARRVKDLISGTRTFGRGKVYAAWPEGGRARWETL